MSYNKTPNPTFIGIGGMKCGTTWLSECLRYHPEIFMSTPKELNFFGPSINWDKGVEWYMGHFRGSKGFKAIGEISVSYLYRSVSAEQIKNTIGRVKIIVLLRNPIERFISHYKYLIRGGNLPKEEYKVLNMDALHRATDLYPQLIGYGDYYRSLKVFIDFFGVSNVCILIKEDIDKNPKVELEKIYNLLEVNPLYVPPVLNKKVSEGIVPRFSSLEALRIRLYHILNRKVPSLVVYIRKLYLAEIYRKINSVKGLTAFRLMIGLSKSSSHTTAAILLI